MKTLFLVRHAKSSWDDINQRDEERPLNERGIRDAPKMSIRLNNRVKSIDKWICSPALRARETANFFANTFKKNIHEINIEPVLYSFNLIDILKFIESQNDIENSIILFFHNPSISEVLIHYTFENFDMPTCAIAQINFITQSWKELSANSGELAWYDYPKNV